MTQIIERIKLDATGYDYSINETGKTKTGSFTFETDSLIVEIGYIADDGGNVEELTPLLVTDFDDNPAVFEIADDATWVAIADQIEPFLWPETEQPEAFSMRSLGLTNSDFLYG